jgi:hypothetical protein
MSLQERAVRAFDEASASLDGSAHDPLRAILEDAKASILGPMRVAVAGRIKTGKSTMINALLGEPIVATGPEELTYNVNWFVHDETPGLVVHFKDDRPPEPRPISWLERLANRGGADPELLRSIRHIEVKYPRDILTRLELIDTPGFDSFFDTDSRNALEFLGISADDIDRTTRQHAVGADAVLYLFARSVAATDQNIVADFQGSGIGDFTPVNAIAVLTKTDAYWLPDEPEADPLAVGAAIARRIASEPGVERTFFAVLPLCGLLAAGAATLSARDLESMRDLARVPPDVLLRRLRYADRFATRPYDDLPVSAERRSVLVEHLGQYGIWIACDLLRAASLDLPALRAGLLEHSGLPALQELLLSHFGNRAVLIKTAGAVNRSRVACARAAQQLSDASVSSVAASAAAAAGGRLEAFEVDEHAVAELGLLRALYRHQDRLGLTADEVTELLAVTGEHGRTCAYRLAMDPRSTPDEMLGAAGERARYWSRRSDDFGMPSSTAYAARTLLRSYELISHHLRAAKRHLELDE